MSESFRVAVVQATPAFLDLAESTARACARIAEAAAAGAEIVALGETWLPGYPVWIDAAPGAALWGDARARALYTRLVQQSPTLDGPEVAALHRAAAEGACDVAIGIHERRGHTLYNTLLLLSRDGRTRRVRRKLVPTYTERMIWGRGDGSTLDVLDTPHGPLGGMICWEHWMPALRQVMHARHELVHVAQWPTGHDLHQLASRQYAFEGGCFVLCCGSTLTRGEAIASYRALGEDAGLELLESIEGDDSTLLLAGGSAIIAPDTRYLAGPADASETILFAEIDPAEAQAARLTLDVDGHYSRPDLFRLHVDTRPRHNVVTDAEERSDADTSVPDPRPEDA